MRNSGGLVGLGEKVEVKTGLPAQAKKHAESAKNTLLTWKENDLRQEKKRSWKLWLQVSQKDLAIALGRASLAICRLNLPLAYLEKAIGHVLASKGDMTSDLVSLYEEIAQIEQLRRNHEQGIQYLKQVHSICVSMFTEVSPKTAKVSELLAKAYAMSGETQHR
ncbi:hypothetical protein MC885_000660, partial [Smutsia gigantea]